MPIPIEFYVYSLLILICTIIILLSVHGVLNYFQLSIAVLPRFSITIRNVELPFYIRQSISSSWYMPLTLSRLFIDSVIIELTYFKVSFY